MTAPTLTSRPKPAQPRRLRLTMRDGTTIEGQVQIGEDQSLVAFLNTRRGGWMNMTGAKRLAGDAYAGHMILQADQVVTASALDGNVQVAGGQGAGAVERRIEIALAGGKIVNGSIAAAPQQRLSDIIASTGKFLGLVKATLLPGNHPLGDIVLHTSAIEFVRDLRPEGATGESHAGGGDG